MRTAEANKTAHKFATIPINKTQVCFSFKSISAQSISKHRVSISLTLSFPFRDLFAAYFEAMAWKVYCGES